MPSIDEKRPRVSSHPGHPPLGTAKQQAGEMATMHDDDERLLAQIGYEQVASISWPLSLGFSVLTKL